ncbi:hypothetical protein [Fischerella thermalis]|uniref:hypothetical protein n=1 Tax=Fischerella thermalis TaxID=372787 RepID=UPI001CA4FD01|nr:hypothetical protein [Fischerella thermalis]
MPRPKKIQEETTNVTVRIPPKDWEALKQRAALMGLNRTELIMMIAQGKISLSQPSETTVLLGKY